MKKIIFTIDLEDLSYDFKRRIGIRLKEEIRVSALLENYKQINKLLLQNNIKITFFCTGILAKYCPEIIRQISLDGHEIASQYFYHDYANKDDLKTFEKRISDSINILTNLSNNKIVGFRAPYFSLKTTDIDHYKILEKYFEYDSSLLLDIKDHENDVKKLKNRLSNNIKIHPILYYSPVPKLKLRLGGTFFKILPHNIIDNLIKKITRSNNCIMYLHPYDYDNKFSYKSKFRDLGDLNLMMQVYYYLKQFQWMTFGNNDVIKKLEKLIKNYNFYNLMKDLKD